MGKMGRTEPSIGRPPAGFRRDARAKQAKATINKVIPSLLATHQRAREGIAQARLIRADELAVNLPTGQEATRPSNNSKEPAARRTRAASTEIRSPRLVLKVADTLTAAYGLLSERSPRNGLVDLTNKKARVAILNMASPLSPGGGFLNGASSQEESLCMRTTLLPSLRDEHYRLPELGAIYTPDVLVFRDETVDKVLDKNDRWFVNCITAAMLRGPETERDADGRGKYINSKDREIVVKKMKMVLRICQEMRIRKVVLGVWGCGAYGNPVDEVAAAWRKVFGQQTWHGVEEVVFAIKDPGMAEAFGSAFGDGLTTIDAEEGEDEGENEASGPVDSGNDELQEKIRELEGRIERATNPRLKEGLLAVHRGLVQQLDQDGP